MPHGDLPAAGALVQPIMAKWLGNSFNMFEEIFDWTDESDEQTRKPLSPAFLTRLIPPLVLVALRPEPRHAWGCDLGISELHQGIQLLQHEYDLQILWSR